MKNKDIYDKANELLVLLEDHGQWSDYLNETDYYLKQIAKEIKHYLETGNKKKRIARTRRDDHVQDTTMLTDMGEFSKLMSGHREKHQ